MNKKNKLPGDVYRHMHVFTVALHVFTAVLQLLPKMARKSAIPSMHDEGCGDKPQISSAKKSKTTNYSFLSCVSDLYLLYPVQTVSRFVHGQCV